MDEARVAELRRWAASLERSETSELRAAGRAITVLCAENESLSRRVAELERHEERPPPPATTPGGGARPSADARRRRTFAWRRAVVALVGCLVAAALVGLAAQAARADLRAGGPAGTVGRAALPSLAFWAEADGATQTWTLDGRPVTPAREGTRVVLRPHGLADGRHTLVVRADRRLRRASSRTFHFTVDTTPPRLRLDAPAVARRGRPLAVAGTLEPGATLAVDGRSVAVDADGGFALRAPSPPARLVLTTTDGAGNRSRWRVPVTIVPRRPTQPVRAVHVTAYAWADRDLREGVLALVRAGKINAVELDLKDEAGEIGWNAPVPLGRRIGAVRRVYDLEAAVDRLHREGVRVIGRLVCFRDPIHAKAAWAAGRRDDVVQASGGGPYSGYGGFTNVASPAVRRYQIDVAVAAAALGVDEILYDYVRRPDGPLSTMVFPGLKGTPERAIVEFLRETRAALGDRDVLLGASVFGVAATRPKEVAQDIPAIAREVDYVAPMVYPSHWGPGEYDVADPNASPYEITRRSVADFVRLARGTGARIVPWLQDFSLGRTYGPAEVAAQIRAARDAGAGEFLLWDAAVSYTADALAPDAARPALGLTTAAPADAPGPTRLPDAPQKRAGRASLPANELGEIPVVMHHMIRADRVGEYDQTPAEFRAELELLWKRGYVPIRASDLVSGRIDVAAGKTPVVLTFDDATTYQAALGPDGEPRAGTAVGIMRAFARTHPGFEPAGTFYVNRAPFSGGAAGAGTMRWLADHGFELGNHTRDHVALRTLDDAQVQRQLALGARVIEDVVPGYRIATMALPLGSLPRRAGLAVRGTWRGRPYGPYGVLLVGANPAPSPYSRTFDAGAIPRIRTSHAGWAGAADYAFAYWMRELARHPERRFVSDGDPATITVAAGAEGEVAPRFRARIIARAAPS
ncbi:MAG: putative glycoside hydrolase [Pseudomonadota bacterium]